MAGTPKDYINEASADYDTIQFNVEPDDILFEEGAFNQEAVEFDDDSVAVMTRNAIPKLYFKLKWSNILLADANTIFDFYFDILKAKGKARTFEFPHPTDGNTYIVQFWCDLTRSIQNLYNIKEITLKIRGYKA